MENKKIVYWVDETETFYEKENEITDKFGYVKYEIRNGELYETK